LNYSFCCSAYCITTSKDTIYISCGRGDGGGYLDGPGGCAGVGTRSCGGDDCAGGGSGTHGCGDGGDCEWMVDLNID